MTGCCLISIFVSQQKHTVDHLSCQPYNMAIATGPLQQLLWYTVLQTGPYLDARDYRLQHVQHLQLHNKHTFTGRTRHYYYPIFTFITTTTITVITTVDIAAYRMVSHAVGKSAAMARAIPRLQLQLPVLWQRSQPRQDCRGFQGSFLSMNTLCITML